MTKLDQLRKITTVVADTGDLAAIRKYAPVDATTNPSLLLKAAADPACQPLVAEAIRQGGGDAEAVMDHLAVAIGRDILAVIPGRVSTEVSARLSFDTAATLARARSLIDRYDAMGVGRDRVLIKIAATWEGICAAEVLEKEGIQCNLTLLFSFAQAQACADAGVFLISPFVGRIYDWYRASTGRDYQGSDDPGVQSVSRIFNYYKQHGYSTVVMGASFRNCGQIEALAGCDRLTISPQLLEQLAAAEGALVPTLDAANPRCDDARQVLDEAEYRWALNDDAMASDKLAEGIRKFHEDELALRKLLATLTL